MNQYLIAVILLCCVFPSFANDEVRIKDFQKLEQNFANQTGKRLPVIIKLVNSKSNRSSQLDFARISDLIMQELAPTSSEITQNLSELSMMAISLSLDGLTLLKANPQVERIYDDQIRKPHLNQGIVQTQAVQAHSRGKKGADVAVAIIDTGVWHPHYMFDARGLTRVVEEACFSTTRVLSGITFRSNCWLGRPSTGKDSAVAPCNPCTRGMSHGTQVTGIAAGKAFIASPRLTGVATLADIIAINVFSRVDNSRICGRPSVEYGSACLVAFDSDILAALNHVFSLRNKYNIAAVNMSLGGGRFRSQCDSGSVYASIVRRLKSQNIATIASSGNGGSAGEISEPACVSDVIAVGSVNNRNQVSRFSDSNAQVDFLAPGEDIRSSGDRYLNDYKSGSGTSFSAPFVTGAFAILKSHKQALTVDEIKELLVMSGKSITDTKNGISKPLIQISDALDLVKKPIPLSAMMLLLDESE